MAKPMAFTSRYLNYAENCPIGELELLAVVWGLEKFHFYLYGKVVSLYHQALAPLIKRNRAYRRCNAGLTRWPDRVAQFDISAKYAVAKV